MPVTMLDIAHETGLSRRTVGLALSSRAHLLRPETCTRVRAACERMGYRPNSSALAMKSGRFNCLGLLQSAHRFHSYLPGTLADGIHAELLEHNLQLVVARLGDERLTDPAFVPRLLQQYTCDGLLLDYINDVPQRLADLIVHYRIPSIWMNAKRATDCAYHDDFAGGVQAVEQVARRGHRRIAYLRCAGGYSTRERHYSELDRRDGYRAGMQAAGLTPQVAGDGQPIAQQAAPAFVRELLTAADRPTAFVVYSDFEAAAVVVAALGLGLRLPRDVMVVGFAGTEIQVGGVPVATMLLAEQELGRRAVRLLLAKIAAPAVALPAEALPLRWAGEPPQPAVL